ncbi:MAG: polysaccharide biosynthesis tyrosine autokinase [Acidimicrobiia bacterium]|nr:polysaccharide biosynthesis tyrosine autokinase [Acidimicrobiia bacterium]
MMYEAGAGAKETPGLEEYLAAIRQRKWLVVVCTVLGLALASLFIVNRTPSYTAIAKVLVNPTTVGTTNQSLQRAVLERERGVLASNVVAEAVIADLDLSITTSLLLRDLEVDFVDKSETLDLSYTDENPELAQDVVNTFASAYVDKRVREANDLDATSTAQYQASIDEIDLESEALVIEEERLIAERTRIQGAGGNANTVQDQIASVRSELNTLRTRRNELVRNIDAIEFSQNTRIEPAEVLRFSVLPQSPNGFSDNILRALGLIVGGGIGIGLAFVSHRLDRTARDSSDVELALRTTVLASVPPFGLGHRGGSSAVVMLSGGRSARTQQARESFRRLRSSLQFLGTTRNASTFLITSARTGEGKSTTVANLAVALAQGGTSVCIVNADLRRPTLERILGVPNRRGIAEWMVDPTVTDIMLPVSGTEGLVLVPAGTPPPNPGELLATGRLADLLEELSTQFDIVIVDAPPILSAADASSIAPSVDGTLIVVDANRTDTDALLRVRSEIQRAGGDVVGAILNRDSSDTGIRLRKDHYAYEKISASRASQ